MHGKAKRTPMPRELRTLKSDVNLARSDLAAIHGMVGGFPYPGDAKKLHRAMALGQSIRAQVDELFALCAGRGMESVGDE